MGAQSVYIFFFFPFFFFFRRSGLKSEFVLVLLSYKKGAVSSLRPTVRLDRASFFGLRFKAVNFRDDLCNRFQGHQFKQEDVLNLFQLVYPLVSVHITNPYSLSSLL
jgi:hypothetical protein